MRNPVKSASQSDHLGPPPPNYQTNAARLHIRKIQVPLPPFLSRHIPLLDGECA